MRSHGEGDDMGSKAPAQGREWANGVSKETPHTSGCGQVLGQAQHGQLPGAGASNRAYEMAIAGKWPDAELGPETHQGRSSSPGESPS